jgi:hypothetical protein
MQLFKTVCVLLGLGALPAQPATAKVSLGAQGSEGEPDRRQQWLLPSSDPVTAPHAILFRLPVDFQVLPASGSEGHWLVETEGGVKSAAPELAGTLKTPAAAAAKKR